MEVIFLPYIDNSIPEVLFPTGSFPKYSDNTC